MQKKSDLAIIAIMMLGVIGLVVCWAVASTQYQSDGFYESKCCCEHVKVSKDTEEDATTDSAVSLPKEASETEETVKKTQVVEVREIVKEVPVVVTEREPINEYYEAYCEASKLLEGYSSMPDEDWMDITQANVETMEQAKGYYDALQNFREVSSVARVDGYEQGIYDTLNN